MTKDIIEFAKFLAVLVAIFGGVPTILYWVCRLAAGDRPRGDTPAAFDVSTGEIGLGF